LVLASQLPSTLRVFSFHHLHYAAPAVLPSQQPFSLSTQPLTSSFVPFSKPPYPTLRFMAIKHLPSLVVTLVPWQPTLHPLIIS